MKENFDYRQVPSHYLHCLNAQCQRSADCLRFQMSLCAGRETVQLLVLNPTHIAGLEDECPHFHPDRLTRYASGITHLYDRMLYAQVLNIRKILQNYFGRNTYYRIRNHQRLIKPKEQAFIQQLFLREGIPEEPVFDQYIDQYEW